MAYNGDVGLMPLEMGWHVKLHPDVEAAVEFESALDELASGRVLPALAHLEKALELLDNPSWYSYLGYCIAKQRGQLKKGIDLCHVSLGLEPEVSAHYLNLGKIYLLTGNKPEALNVLRNGMLKGKNKEIQRLLDDIGMRKPPVIASLSRNNLLNRYLGILFNKFGLR
jgi:tetratricopeptide (TPR) repeat protein